MTVAPRRTISARIKALDTGIKALSDEYFMREEVHQHSARPIRLWKLVTEPSEGRGGLKYVTVILTYGVKQHIFTGPERFGIEFAYKLTLLLRDVDVIYEV